MIILIESLENGAVVRFDPGEGSPVECFAYPHDDEGQAEYKLQLLRDIAESLFGHDDRYAARRVDVRFIHGDKHECRLGKACTVCGGATRA